jgi:MoaA/NifB/PqqE/SkfB family radical SAM enzyme
MSNFNHLLNQIKHHDIAEAKLMGMGEPFMNPHFDQITARFKEVFPRCNVISATNCQIALNRTFKEALKYIDECYLSIDGDRENYERIRTGSKWSKLLSFLSELQEYAPEVKCRFPINFTICPENVYDIDLMLELVERYALDSLRLNFVQNWDEGSSDLGMLNGFTDAQFKHLQQYRQYFRGKSVWDYSDCFWVKNGLYVTVDGNVRVCCMNTSTAPLGNMFQQPLSLIRQGSKFQEIRLGCELNQPTSHCVNCSYKELTPFLNRIMNV